MVRRDDGRVNESRSLTEAPPGLLDSLRQGRELGADWLVSRIGDDGKPFGADVRNSWSRLPWALSVAGRPDQAAAVLAWVERHGLTDDGDFRPGPARGADESESPVYWLAQVALGAWLVGHYDTADAVMGCLLRFWDERNGGVNDRRDGSVQDFTKTAQLGLTALVMGRTDVAADVRAWLGMTYDAQPELPSCLYARWQGASVITDFAEDQAFTHVVDFRRSRQAYFLPGLAAAFLAGHARQLGDRASLELGRRYLQLNIEGTERQFDDPESVQICKFGWGAAAMLTADPGGGHLTHVVRMGQWFLDRQDADGAWSPSSFLVPEPGDLDRLWKSAEHLMELSSITQSLTVAQAAR